MLLQHIRSEFNNDADKALYVSLDNLWFATHSLVELADIHYMNGGTHIFLDEVHFLKDWQVNLLNILSSKKSTLKNMARPDKIYCDNPNIMYSLTENINIGTKRETFFLNQLKSAGHEVLYPDKGDFMVDDKYLFEVGGKDKSFNQIKDIPDSFLAIDDVEIGRGNRIPLWMFGLLY